MGEVKMMGPDDNRERILVYGGPGTGKSTAALSVIAATGANAWVLDTERAWGVMVSREWHEIENQLEVWDVRRMAMKRGMSEWEVIIEALGEIVKEMGADDWLVIDSITPTWDDVQAWFTDQVFGKDIEDFFLAARKQMEGSGKKGGSPFEGFVDWPTINKQYAKLYNLILMAPGHVLLTAEAAPLAEKNEDTNTLATYAVYGSKPKGQKRLGYIPHTVLQTSRNMTGKWVVTTVKERGSKRLDGAVVDDFARVYLRGVAGWEPTAVVKARAKKEAG